MNNLIYNPVSKKLGTTENTNWYTDLKSNITSIFVSSDEKSVTSSINNAINDINSTINTITKSFESSGLIENIMSISSDINTISANISNIINNENLSYEDKTILLKLQKAIDDGTLVKQLPANANINDYQMITINNNTFYIKKNKTKQYIIYGLAIVVVLSIIMFLLKKKR